MNQERVWSPEEDTLITMISKRLIHESRINDYLIMH